MTARRNHWLLICSLALTAAGCATLPGFDRTEYVETSAWFERADEPVETPQEHEPEVHRITPTLIRDLQNTPLRGPTAFPSEQINASTDHYTIGIGDLLGVIVYGHPDITNPAGLTQTFESSGRPVDANGEIFIPFAGSLKVVGLTTSAARDLITENLRRVINDPQVDVRVLKYRSQKVFITGDISRPCTVSVTDIPLTIIDALKDCESQVAGRNNDILSVNSLQLLRDGTAYPINLSLLYRTGGGPILLRNGDRLIIDNRLNRVFVIGEFAEQIAVPVAATELTLADAMAAAGGLDLETANTSAIFVIRGFVSNEAAEDGGVKTVFKPTVYHLDASAVDAMLLADHFLLQPRDVVYAAPARFVSFNRALAQITPSIDALFRSVIVADRIND